MPKPFQFCRVIGVPAYLPKVDEEWRSFVVSEDTPKSCLSGIALRGAIKIELDSVLRGRGPRVLPAVVFHHRGGGVSSQLEVQIPICPDGFFIGSGGKVVLRPFTHRQGLLEVVVEISPYDFWRGALILEYALVPFFPYRPKEETRDYSPKMIENPTFVGVLVPLT